MTAQMIEPREARARRTWLVLGARRTVNCGQLRMIFQLPRFVTYSFSRRVIKTNS